MKGKQPLTSVVGDYVFSERIFQVQTTPQVVATASAERCNLWIYNPSGGAAITLSTRGDLLVGQGLVLNPADQWFNFNSRDHSAICWQMWYSIAGLPVNVRVFEVFYRPGR